MDRYAKEAVEEVLLYYSMADLSIESVLDQHIQGCVEVDKVCERFCFDSGLLNSVETSCSLNNKFLEAEK